MSRHLPLPSNLGRYRLLSKLGEGGMGMVYLAEDTELGRRVALKVPHFSDDDGEEIVKRFQREARVAAGVTHANLCPVYDVGQVDGVYYLSMLYIEGTPLSRLVNAEQPWEPVKALALVRKLALAIQVMHDKGVVHRDLKPANVMIRPDGEPVLMDFGLARSFAVQSRQLTQTGAPLGTPAYMAPEQVLGDAGKIGPATDLYSLGMVLYELLTGQVAFDGPLAAIYGQILHATPETPSIRRPGLDGQLDALCLKALAKKPEHRFASMREVAAQLEAYLRHQAPVASRVAEPTPVTVAPDQPSLTPRAHGPEGPGTTAPVRLTCPRCGKVLTGPPIVAGRNAKCPHCETRLDVPAEKQTLPGPAPAERKPLSGYAPRIPSGARDASPLAEKADLPRAIPEEGPLAKKRMLLVAGAALLVAVGGLTVWLLVRGNRSDTLPSRTDDAVEPAASLRLLAGAPIALEPGATVSVPVKVARQHCSGPIQVRLASPSPGITVREALIGKDSDECTLRLTVDNEVSAGERTLRLLAEAEKTRAAGAIQLSISRPVPSLTLVLQSQVTVPPGESRTVLVRIKRRGCPGLVEVRQAEPLPGLAVLNGQIQPGADEGSVELRVDKNAQLGPRTLRLLAVAGDVRAEGTVQLTIRGGPPPIVQLRQRPKVLEPDEVQVAVIHGAFPVLQVKAQDVGSKLEITEIMVVDGTTSDGYSPLQSKAFQSGPQGGGGIWFNAPRRGNTAYNSTQSHRRFTRPPRNKTQWLPLSEIQGKTPAIAVLPSRVAIIAASFPYRQQIEEHKRALHLKTVGDVLTEHVRGEKGKKPESWPSFAFDGVEVERMTLNDDGSDGKWKPLDVENAYRQFVVLTNRSLETDKPDYKPILAASRGLAMPVPAQLPDDLKTGKRSAAREAPDLLSRLEKIQKTLEKVKQANTKDVVPPSSPLNDNFDIYNVDESFGGRGGPTPPGGGSSPVPPTGNDTDNMYNAIKGDAERQKTIGDDTPLDHCLVRFVDVHLEPGKAYKYRFKVRMMNPNYSPEPTKRKDTYPQFAKDRVLTSQNWAYTGLVTVPPDQYVYALNLPDYGTKLNIEMKKQEPWRWTFVGLQGAPPFQQRSQAAVQIHRWVDEYRPNPDEPRLQTVGEWLVAARILVERGEYVRDPGYRVPVPIKPPDLFEHELDNNRKLRSPVDRPVMAVEFGDETLLIDFEGGDVRYTSTEIKDEKPQTKSINDECGIELLMMRPDGKVIAHNSAIDGDNKVRKDRAEAFTKRIENLRNPRRFGEIDPLKGDPLRPK